MSATRNSTPAHLAAQPTDSGLRCPRCEYNLTGLTEARCPECGALFSWEAVRAAAERRPTIAFERARGWRKIPAFFLTWATVLFAPWVFARQIVQRAGVGHALIFGATCFLPVTGRYAVDGGFGADYFAWVSAAAIYIMLQATVLTLLDPTAWRKPFPGFCFWLAVGGYTTAIVATECWHHPPLLSLPETCQALREFLAGRVSVSEILHQIRQHRLSCLLLGLWLPGPACCYVARLRKRRLPLVVLVPLTLLCVTLLLGLYALCVDPIGTALYGLYGGGYPF